MEQSSLLHRTAPDAKIFPNTSQATRVAKPAREKGMSEDSQLDRLLADGWEIESEDDNAVHLTKIKKGKQRRLTHHRPKRNGKGK